MSSRFYFVSLVAVLALLSACQSGGMASSPSAQPAADPAAQSKALIYVSSGGAVAIVSVPGYAEIGSITQGINGPAGLWIDKAGRLYVANSSGQNVTEYAPGTNSPMCTYSVPSGRPDFVTTDDHGHVYVTAFISTYGSASSWIYDYNQCGNLIKQYAWPHAGQFVDRVGGVAVDANGNVFVRFSTRLEEFDSGAAFVPTTLPVTSLGFPSALILDANNNLIAANQAYTVYVIPPPYVRTKVLANGLNFPRGLSLNEAENRLFVVDDAQETVKIYQYPSGAFVREFGASQGLGQASGVTHSPDAVF